MIEQLFGFGSQVGVDIETVLDKGIEFWTPFIGVFEALDGFVLELPHGDEGFEVRVGDYSFSEFDGSDSEGPDVGFIGVFAVFHDFWAHPVGRTDLGFVACVGVHAFG